MKHLGSFHSRNGSDQRFGVDINYVNLSSVRVTVASVNPYEVTSTSPFYLTTRSSSSGKSGTWKIDGGNSWVVVLHINDGNLVLSSRANNNKITDIILDESKVRIYRSVFIIFGC